MEKETFHIAEPFNEARYREGLLRNILSGLSVYPLPSLPFDISFVKTGFDVMCEDVGNVVAHLSLAPLRSPILLLHALSLECFPKDATVCAFWRNEERVSGLTSHTWISCTPCEEPVIETVPNDYVPGGVFIACYKSKRF